MITSNLFSEVSKIPYFSKKAEGLLSRKTAQESKSKTQKCPNNRSSSYSLKPLQAVLDKVSKVPDNYLSKQWQSQEEGQA